MPRAWGTKGRGFDYYNLEEGACRTETQTCEDRAAPSGTAVSEGAQDAVSTSVCKRDPSDAMGRNCHCPSESF